MKNDTLEYRVGVAKSAAQKAGKLAIEMRAARGQGFVGTKGQRDFVTLADLEVERLIRDELSHAFPTDAIVGDLPPETFLVLVYNLLA